MAIQQIEDTKREHPVYAGKDHHQRAIDRFAYLCENILLEHWATIITAMLGAVVALAFLVPVLSYLGLGFIAKPLFFAMHFICEQVPSHSFYLFGYQLGLCERNLAIYSSMFLGGLLFVLTKKRLLGIPWWLWVLLILPMAWDGTTQMFGWRESTWALRLATGTLFGLGTIWFTLPLMQKAIVETSPALPAQNR